MFLRISNRLFWLAGTLLGMAVLTFFLVLAANRVGDVLYRWIDPRIQTAA